MRHKRDTDIRHALGLPYNRPWSRYVLGRSEARAAFVEGEMFTLNAYDAESRYKPGVKTRFYNKAEHPYQNTLYRIRVKPKGVVVA